jgi:diguanylate cyclase (GGDEF)-like protein
MRIPRHGLFLGAGIAATAAYLVLPWSLGTELSYELIGAAAVVAIVAGSRGKGHRLPWLLMAAGQALFVAGDLTWVFYGRVLHVDPWPSPADGLYLAGYPVLAVALWLLLRDRSPGRDVAGLLDAAIVSSSLGVLGWVWLVGPLAAVPGQPLTELLISLAYPVGDVLLLVVLVRLVAAPGARNVAFLLLSGSILLLLLADVAFMLVSPSGGYVGGGPIDGLWLLSYVLWGTAALHPAARALSARGEAGIKPSRLRLVLLACAATLCPSLLVQRALVELAPDVWVLGVGSIVIFLLVIARMVGLVRQIEFQVVLLDRGQQALRETIAEKEALADQLRYQAFHDSLTGLPNRALLRDRLRHALERGRRGQERVGLLFVDLDDFKQVNDDFGHDTGDRTLQEVGTRLRRSVRASDTVARLGGDEFAVLIEDAVGEEEVREAQDRIERALREPLESTGGSVTVRASIGRALAGGRDDADAILRAADEAMYGAKRAAKSGAPAALNSATR